MPKQPMSLGNMAACLNDASASLMMYDATVAMFIALAEHDDVTLEQLKKAAGRLKQKREEALKVLCPEGDD